MQKNIYYDSKLLNNLLLVKATQWIILNHLQINFRSNKISNVIQSIFNHGRPVSIISV